MTPQQTDAHNILQSHQWANFGATLASRVLDAERHRGLKGSDQRLHQQLAERQAIERLHFLHRRLLLGKMEEDEDLRACLADIHPEGGLALN